MERAKHIDTLVRRECSATELLHRKFECGDARTFQGSERDIVFLSLVVDVANCKAVSGNLFDASTPEAYQKRLQAIKAKLSPEETRL